jgi:hypothetical protein
MNMGVFWRIVSFNSQIQVTLAEKKTYLIRNCPRRGDNLLWKMNETELYDIAQALSTCRVDISRYHAWLLNPAVANLASTSDVWWHFTTYPAVFKSTDCTWCYNRCIPTNLTMTWRISNQFIYILYIYITYRTSKPRPSLRALMPAEPFGPPSWGADDSRRNQLLAAPNNSALVQSRTATKLEDIGSQY